MDYNKLLVLLNQRNIEINNEMKIIKLISSQQTFYKEFERCCKKYSSLEIFTAWVGNPGNIVPFAHLEYLRNVKVNLGISFNQSSPQGIRYLMDKRYKVNIVDSERTFHPKLYFFRSASGVALLLGSSNFTYSGFYENIESNMLLEGNGYKALIFKYVSDVKKETAKSRNFTPDQDWLAMYEKAYKKRKQAFKRHKFNDEAIKEDRLISGSSWLGSGDWGTYFRHIRKGGKKHQNEYGEDLNLKIQLLSEYKAKLRTPWMVSLFDDIENRRMLLGKRNYGWLGHVGASGRIQQLLTNGSPKEKEIIVETINRISVMNLPLDYVAFRKELHQLEKLGPSVKVWGRFLALARPDVFCTVSSTYVRESLSILLNKSKSYFENGEGYVELLKLIHHSPWYNTKKPKTKLEEQIWRSRVAFLDVVFY